MMSEKGKLPFRVFSDLPCGGKRGQEVREKNLGGLLFMDKAWLLLIVRKWNRFIINLGTEYS